jgi:4,4'-diapophytoene synthase
VNQLVVTESVEYLLYSYAFDLLPESERRAVWAVYAVCRIIDDSIDEEQNPQKLKD